MVATRYAMIAPPMSHRLSRLLRTLRGRDDAGVDEEVLAKVGRVSGRIEPGSIGEVMLPVRGGTEAFSAYGVDDAVIQVGTRVIVIDFEPPRTVRVQPY